MFIHQDCKRTEDTVQRSTSTCRSAKDTGFIPRDATKLERERYDEPSTINASEVKSRSKQISSIMGVPITFVHYNGSFPVFVASRRVEALQHSLSDVSEHRNQQTAFGINQARYKYKR